LNSNIWARKAKKRTLKTSPENSCQTHTDGQKYQGLTGHPGESLHGDDLGTLVGKWLPVGGEGGDVITATGTFEWNDLIHDTGASTPEDGTDE
jgi:hypothetical protein